MKEPKSQIKRREILVRLLAAYYIKPTDDNPISGYESILGYECSGISCGALGCPYFWESFFSCFSTEDVHRMIESYRIATGTDSHWRT